MEPSSIAKTIKTELRGLFPSIKFSVTSRTGLNNAIYIKWKGDLLPAEVRNVVEKYNRITRCQRTGKIIGGDDLYIFCEHLGD